MVLEGEASFTPALTLSRGDLVRLRDVRPGAWRAGATGVRWLDVLGRSDDGCPYHRSRACAAPCRPLPRVHRWARTEAVFAHAARMGSFPRIARFGSPARDVTSTLRAEVHRLDPGRWTPIVQSDRHAVVIVLAGSGASVVDGRRIGWDAGDVIAIEPRAAAGHRAAETADLLVVSDAPARV